MNVVIILLGAILINMCVRDWITSDNIDDIIENLEKILRKMDEK